MMEFLILKRGKKKKAAASTENFTASIIFLQHEDAVFLVMESDLVTIDVTNK